MAMWNSPQAHLVVPLMVAALAQSARPKVTASKYLRTLHDLSYTGCKHLVKGSLGLISMDILSNLACRSTTLNIGGSVTLNLGDLGSVGGTYGYS